MLGGECWEYGKTGGFETNDKYIVIQPIAPPTCVAKAV